MTVWQSYCLQSDSQLVGEAGAMLDAGPPAQVILDGSVTRHMSAARDVSSLRPDVMTGHHDTAPSAALDPFLEIARSNDVSALTAGTIK